MERINSHFYKVKVYPYRLTSPIIGCGRTKELAYKSLLSRLEKLKESIEAQIALTKHDIERYNGK